MSDPDLRSYLGRLPFLAGLSNFHLDQLASFAVSTRYTAQQRLFKSDTAADSFYIVRDGKVCVEIPAVAGEPLRIQTLGNDGVLGWSWLVPPYRWSFDARVLAPSEIITMDGARLRQQCDQDTILGYQLLKRFAALMAERLNASRIAAIKEYSGH